MKHAHAVLLIATLLVPIHLAGQIEIGLDATIEIQNTSFDLILPVDPPLTKPITIESNPAAISLPNGRVRVGFFTAPTFSLEFDTTFQRRSERGSSHTTWTMNGAPMFHFAPIRSGGHIAYLGPKIGFSLTADSGFADADVTHTLGGSIGIKSPLEAFLLLRVEGFFLHQFESDSRKSVDTFGIAIGLSFLTK